MMMSGQEKSFQQRIDWEAVRRLRERGLAAPVDTLNLVSFKDKVSYFWYGLLLAPRLLVMGARPVWVAAHQECLLGDKFAGFARFRLGAGDDHIQFVGQQLFRQRFAAPAPFCGQ